MFDMANIPLRTVRELGSFLKARRLELGLTQQQLADLLGTQRQWVIRLEAGNEGAELGLVLLAIDTLDLEWTLVPKAPSHSDPGTSTLDAVFSRLKPKDGQ